MEVKKRRLRCFLHISKGRTWNDYVYQSTTVDGLIDNYYCKECKIRESIESEKYLIQKQKEEAQQKERWRRFQIKMEKKKEKIEKSIIEDLWDKEVIRILSLNLKMTYAQKKQFSNSIPKEVIQLKRAQIKLERLIKGKKKHVKNK